MSIRNTYEEFGVDGFYREYGSTYRNPHESIIRQAIPMAVVRWSLDLTRVLDLACGSGEATLALYTVFAKTVDGIDPYTGAAYLERTAQIAELLTFEDIAAGALVGRRYSLIVCSFALHLIDESRIPLLAYQLAGISPALLVLTPHKRPEIETHWSLYDEFVHERVHVRFYRSEQL